METNISPNPLYDLSNPHFRKVEIVNNHGEQLKGQFVQFKVVKGDVEYLYPSEKFCFLPEGDVDAFWYEYSRNNGEFTELPSYIKQLGLHEMKKIIIAPKLI